MLRRLSRLPLVVMLMAVACLLMLLPSAHALALRDFHNAQVFFYSALLFGFVTLFLGLATAQQSRERVARRQLLALMGVFVVLPAMLAVPFREGALTTSYFNAYVEMVSALTTTGATLFDDPARLAPSLHLWRALVAWLGGLIMWVAAAALLAPLALGGFELRAARVEGPGNGRGLSQITKVADLPARIGTYTAQLLPVYALLTFVLWLGLILAGDTPFVAFIHALSTLSTSGISAVGGLPGAGSGIVGEVLVALFLVFAISRLSFARDTRTGAVRSFARDPEVRMAAAVIGGTALFLFLRHWLGAFDVDDELNLRAALRAAWGTGFTVMSFLTTTGFASADWATARGWSGLETPGLILMGLALIGGGVATTAGGAKLLRVYVLYRHGMRELEKLVLPSSVGRSGGQGTGRNRNGAYIAWMFFMLMTISVAVFMLAFALNGAGFETALVLTVAGLTTTGPLVDMAASTPIDLATLSPVGKLLFTGAMVVGRLEALAIVAVLNPEIWRR